MHTTSPSTIGNSYSVTPTSPAIFDEWHRLDLKSHLIPCVSNVYGSPYLMRVMFVSAALAWRNFTPSAPSSLKVRYLCFPLWKTFSLTWGKKFSQRCDPKSHPSQGMLRTASLSKIRPCHDGHRRPHSPCRAHAHHEVRTYANCVCPCVAIS